ncbi:MAG: hypothetical protein Q7J03_06235 [Methanoregula sp.]|nr:hypothetical protein [Methanoregula sp.]
MTHPGSFWDPIVVFRNRFSWFLGPGVHRTGKYRFKELFLKNTSFNPDKFCSLAGSGWAHFSPLGLLNKGRDLPQKGPLLPDFKITSEKKGGSISHPMAKTDAPYVRFSGGNSGPDCLFTDRVFGVFGAKCPPLWKKPV